MLKFGLIAGSLLSMLSVVLGAFGAHYLKNTLNDYSLSVFQTGVLYQFFHSIGMNRKFPNQQEHGFPQRCLQIENARLSRGGLGEAHWNSE